jgi:hypothetical protein
MRRTLMLGAVTPIVALGLIAFTQTILLAQAAVPKAASPQAPPAATPAAVPSTPFGSDATQLGSDRSDTNTVIPQAKPPARSDNLETPDANPIRQRFLELSKKKAAALNEEDLKREVESMENEVRELEAWVKTQEAVRLLHEVVDKHPNTKAAETANAAIQLIEERRVVPHFTREAPTPGPIFRRGTPRFNPAPTPRSDSPPNDSQNFSRPSS